MVRTSAPSRLPIRSARYSPRLSAFVLLLATICFGHRCLAGETISIKATMPFRPHGIYLRAELSKPKGDGPFPAVVLMHGCGGWQPAVLAALHEHAKYFLNRGYVVLNLDSFGPRGNFGGVVCESDARLVRALDYRTSDAFDALRYLYTLRYVDSADIFLMGQSNGGSVAINVAKSHHQRAFRGVAAYYPWCGSLGAPNVELTSPLIIFSGSRDDWVPARDCRHRTSTGAELKVIEYPDAAHSFDLRVISQRYLGKLIGFDKSATEDSRAKMLAFFAKQFAPSSRVMISRAPIIGGVPTDRVGSR